MHRRGFAVIPFILVAAVTLITATVIYRNSNERQTTSSKASSTTIASDINNTWSRVKPINGVYPWTNGGPTASWERYLPSIGLDRLGVCNTKYCWVYDRPTATWFSGFDMSTNSDFAVQPGPGGIMPWSNNGPTAAWTWEVKSNNPAEFFNLPNGTDILETMTCNKKICWRNIRYPGNPPAGVPANKWRDGGAGKDLSTLNSFWTNPNVAGLWSGDGLTSAWTNPNTKVATLCNHSYCWTLNYANWTWGQRMTSFPVGVSELTSAWISQTTNWFYLCSGAKCWIKNASTGVYENSGNPVFLHNPPTPTWTPVPPTATPRPPTATPRPPTATPTADVLLNCAPRQIAPINNIVVSVPITFQWSTCPGITHYQLQGSGGNFSVPSTTFTGSSYTLGGFALTPNAVYTWNVRACSNSSCSRVTAWSPNQSFKGPAPTAVPTVKPTAIPTLKPTAVPTTKPTATPTTKPVATATPTVKPTATPTPGPTDATINFAVEYTGIASNKTQLPAAETQVRIMNGSSVLKTAQVALQRRSTSNIFAPTQPVSLSVPSAGLTGITIEVKHITSTVLTFTNVTLARGQAFLASPNGEGKLYGGDVNGFNICTNCSYGRIDSFDLNSFLDAYNANRADNTADFNRDGTVSLADFGLLAQNYTKEPQTINLSSTRDE